MDILTERLCLIPIEKTHACSIARYFDCDTVKYMSPPAVESLEQAEKIIDGFTLTVRDNCDSSFGGAMLAGIGCGEYGDFSAALRICAPHSVTVVPDESRRLVYDEAFSRYKELAMFYDGFYGERR